MLFALTTTSCGNEGQLSGTYTFDEVYDLVAYLEDGSRNSAREADRLDEMMDLIGDDIMDIGMFDMSFSFSGSNCTLTNGGGGSMTGSYTLSGNRLVITVPGADGGKISLGYRSSPRTIFIWDFKTFESIGLDPAEEFDIEGVKNLEAWIAMDHK